MIRTLEALATALDEDLAWRKVELATLRRDALCAKVPANVAYKRSGIALLYAHLEGYIKNSARVYVEYVASMRIVRRHLRDPFIALCDEKDLRAAGDDKSIEAMIYYMIRSRDDADAIAKIPFKTAIPTRGNLDSAMLRNIIARIGLDYEMFASKEKMLDELLLDRRNRVAHGEYLGVSDKDYIGLHDQVMGLLEAMRTQILNAAVERRYHRLPP